MSSSGDLMAHLLRFIGHALCALVLVPIGVSAQQTRPKLSEMIHSTGNIGTEFWIAIPPNEINPFPVDELEIYVASAYETEIEVFDAAAGRTYKRWLMPYEIRTLSDKRGETDWTWEVRESEQVVKKGIRITSDQPVSVYVLNSKVTTSDGYMAIPVSSWGTEHIATTYYDFREFKEWAGGFLIIASEDGTEVTVQLRGTGATEGKTAGGRALGSNPFNIVLNQGDVYMVKGDGKTRGVFDLTGTKITSSKPVGLISFHERTTMPNLMINGNGRNHLAEMTPPTAAWGKKYTAIELQRENRNGAGKGDVFRVIARDANTRWTLKYYDKQSKKLLGEAGGLIAKAGEFVDLGQHAAPVVLTHGYSVWEADKPILVLQYSCSSSWDGDPTLDPFMVTVTPDEQFATSAMFQFPTSAKFSKHRLSLIIKTDTSSPNLIDNLKSLEVDGVPVWRHPAAQSPTLLFNQMPGGLYWAVLDFGVESRAHRITSNGMVSFGGHIYGYGAVDAYGWPLGADVRDLTLNDTMPPVITRTTLDCGTFEFEATELRNIPDPPRPVRVDSDQIETGIAGVDTVPGQGSNNYRLTRITDQIFPRTPAYKRFKYRWTVVDRDMPARCVYYVKDWYGNMTIDSCKYVPQIVSGTPREIAFGRTRPGLAVTRELVLTNTSPKEVTITRAYLRKGLDFSITSGAITSPVAVPSQGIYGLTIKYNATRESVLDEDTLVVETSCLLLNIPISAASLVPKIEIEDYDAGYNAPGELTCKSGGLRITNNGTDTLVISKFTGLANSSFSVSTSALTDLPYRLPPGSSYQLRDVCYRRNDMGNDSIRVEFTSNAEGPKPYSIWKGTTLISTVDEQRERDVHVESADDAVRISWTVEGVGSVNVLNLRGQILQSSAMQPDQRQFVVSSSIAARQVIIINLNDAAGNVLRSKKVVLH